MLSFYHTIVFVCAFALSTGQQDSSKAPPRQSTSSPHSTPKVDGSKVTTTKTKIFSKGASQGHSTTTMKSTLSVLGTPSSAEKSANTPKNATESKMQTQQQLQPKTAALKKANNTSSSPMLHRKSGPTEKMTVTSPPLKIADPHPSSPNKKSRPSTSPTTHATVVVPTSTHFVPTSTSSSKMSSSKKNPKSVRNSSSAEKTDTSSSKESLKNVPRVKFDRP